MIKMNALIFVRMMFSRKRKDNQPLSDRKTKTKIKKEGLSPSIQAVSKDSHVISDLVID